MKTIRHEKMSAQTEESVCRLCMICFVLWGGGGGCAQKRLNKKRVSGPRVNEPKN